MVQGEAHRKSGGGVDRKTSAHEWEPSDGRVGSMVHGGV